MQLHGKKFNLLFKNCLVLHVFGGFFTMLSLEDVDLILLILSWSALALVPMATKKASKAVHRAIHRVCS